MEGNGGNSQVGFDAKLYLRTRHGERIDEKRSCAPFYLQTFHDFYADHHADWDPRSARLLEFGGGPTIYTLISAAQHVHDITFAEYVDASRDEVRKWVDRDPDAHNWFPYVSFTVNGLEKLLGDQVVREREDLIRSKISSVIPCNVFDDPPVPFPAETFDIIHSCSVIESACETKAEFENCVRQMRRLLRPDGHIVMIVQIERRQYFIGDSVFRVVFLTVEDVHDSLQSAGLKVLSTSLYHIPKEALQIYSGMKAFAAVVAQRVDP